MQADLADIPPSLMTAHETPATVQPNGTSALSEPPPAGRRIGLRSALYVLAGGYALGLFAWELRHGRELGGYLFDNQLAAGQPPGLAQLAIFALGALAVWALLSLLLARARGAALATVADRVAGGFLFLTLPAFLPALALPGIEAEHPLLTLALIALMGLIAGVAVATVRQGAAQPAQPAATGSPVSDPLPAQPAPRSARLSGLLVVLLVGGYVVYMAALTVARHNAFLTHAFDLGIQDQAMYTLVTRGYPLVTLYGSQPVNQLGDHFALIYYLLAPLYAALGGNAAALLVVQSVALGLGAVPVYLLARAKTGSLSVAVALAVAYLLYPALHAVNTFDFHEIALVTPLLLFSLYFLETERRGLFLVFLVLAALTKEEVALSAAAIGLYILWSKRERQLGGLVLIGSLAYFALVTLAIMPALGGGPDLERFSGVAAAGQTGFAAIVLGIVANPIHAFSQAFLNGQKMIFLAQLLLPVLFLPLLAGAAWVMAVPAFAVALLASVPSQYSLIYHYPAIMTPFVFVLAILGLQRLNRRTYDRLALAAAILVVGLAMNYSYGWLASKRPNEFPPSSQHARLLARFVKEIPQQASVSTLSDLAPHLSNRQDIYLFPVVNDADVILFDSDPAVNYWPFTSDDARGEARNALIPLLVSGEYGLVKQEDGVLLLRRGHDTADNQQAVRELLAVRYQAEDLATDLPGGDVADREASNGRARLGQPSTRAGQPKEGLVYGPYAALLPGDYQVAYRLKHLGDGRSGVVATVDVFSNTAGGVLASRDIQTGDFTAPGRYQDFVLDLNLQEGYGDLEFRVLYKGLGELWADAIGVAPVKVAVPVLELLDPGQPAGSNGDPASRVLAQTGPQALSPGMYRATFALTPGVQPDGRLEVFSATAGGPLAEMALSANAFTRLNQPQSFALDFRVEQPWPDVVLRVLQQNGGELDVERMELQYLYQGAGHGEQ